MSDMDLRILAFVAKRSREGCMSRDRKVREQALSDICYHTADYLRLEFDPLPEDPYTIWMGKSP